MTKAKQLITALTAAGYTTSDLERAAPAVLVHLATSRVRGGPRKRYSSPGLLVHVEEALSAVKRIVLETFPDGDWAIEITGKGTTWRDGWRWMILVEEVPF